MRGTGLVESVPFYDALELEMIRSDTSSGVCEIAQGIENRVDSKVANHV